MKWISSAFMLGGTTTPLAGYTIDGAPPVAAPPNLPDDEASAPVARIVVVAPLPLIAGWLGWTGGCQPEPKFHVEGSAKSVESPESLGVTPWSPAPAPPSPPPLPPEPSLPLPLPLLRDD